MIVVIVALCWPREKLRIQKEAWHLAEVISATLFTSRQNFLVESEI